MKDRGKKEKLLEERRKRRKRELSRNEEHIFSCTAVKGVGVGSGSKTNTHLWSHSEGMHMVCVQGGDMDLD